MTNFAAGLVALLAAVAFESLAQLCLKLAATGAAPARQPVAAPARAWLALGLGAYGLEIALYTLALRWLDVSLAFPLSGLSFLGVAFLSKLLLGENLTGARWIGVALILTGTGCLTLPA